MDRSPREKPPTAQIAQIPRKRRCGKIVWLLRKCVSQVSILQNRSVSSIVPASRIGAIASISAVVRPPRRGTRLVKPSGSVSRLHEQRASHAMVRLAPPADHGDSAGDARRMPVHGTLPGVQDTANRDGTGRRARPSIVIALPRRESGGRRRAPGLAGIGG